MKQWNESHFYLKKLKMDLVQQDDVFQIDIYEWYLLWTHLECWYVWNKAENVIYNAYIHINILYGVERYGYANIT